MRLVRRRHPSSPQHLLTQSRLSVGFRILRVCLSGPPFIEYLLRIGSCAKHILYIFFNEETKHVFYLLLRGRLFISNSELEKETQRLSNWSKDAQLEGTELGFELETLRCQRLFSGSSAVLPQIRAQTDAPFPPSLFCYGER